MGLFSKKKTISDEDYEKAFEQERYSSYDDYENVKFSDEDLHERLEKVRDLQREKDMKDFESIEKSKYTEDQLEALEYAFTYGTKKEFILNPEYDVLKIYAVADLSKTGATDEILSQTKDMNFMQIRWCLIPALEREISVLNRAKRKRQDQIESIYDNYYEEEEVKPTVDKDVLAKQMLIMKYMYLALVEETSYVINIELHQRKKTSALMFNPDDRFLVTFSGITHLDGEIERKIIFSHGHTNKVKTLFTFSINNTGNQLGSFYDDMGQELDLNDKKFDFVYDSISQNVKVEPLDAKISRERKDIEKERLAAEEARMRSYAVGRRNH